MILCFLRSVLVEVDGLAFALLQVEGVELAAPTVVWHTRRLSWDGFNGHQLRDGLLAVDAWDAVDDLWRQCTVDLETGRSTGGAFDERDVEGWEVLAPARAPS